jgi:hypothetical protein
MKTILLQIIVFVVATAAIVGVKIMDLPSWLTYPLLVIVVVLAVSGFAGAHS